MQAQQIPFQSVGYAASAVLAVVFWQSGLYLLSAIMLLLGGGVAVARPHRVGSRLMLAGTPVLLMFAVLLISASTMVVAVDRITALFDRPPDIIMPCGDRRATFDLIDD